MIEEDGEYDCLYDLWVIGGHYYGVDNYMRFNARSREELGVDASEEDVVQHSKKLLYDFLSSFFDDECKWSSKDSKILRDAIGEGHSITHIQQHVFNRKWSYKQLQSKASTHGKIKTCVKKWTDEESTLIQDDTKSLEYLAGLLGRSEGAIRIKRSQLNLTEDRKKKHAECQKRFIEAGKNKRGHKKRCVTGENSDEEEKINSSIAFYSDEDKKLLEREVDRGTTVAEISRLLELKWSYPTICRKVRAYQESKGLLTTKKVRPPPLTDDEMKLVADETKSITQVAKELGRQYQFVQRLRMIGKMTALEKKEYDEKTRTYVQKKKKIPCCQKK